MTPETPDQASAATRTPGSDSEPVLELRGINKRFGAVQALTDINLSVGRGEVVGLVGDNGAGKSTLIKVIAGVHAADEGELIMNGTAQRFSSPKDAQRAGVATVFQDLALCENLDVVANLFLGHEKTRGGVLDEVSMEAKSWELLRSLSAKIPSVRVPIAALSGGQRQTVAIARSLLGEPSLVMLDEPTAALGVAQTAEVLNLIERLKERDLGVLLVSHNMADVQAVCERVHVLRLGKDAGDFPGDERTDVLVAAITGASDNVVTKRAARRGERR
ncbi:ATP-binding cassette domain-containing protein [Brevibacterium linens]|uniref:Monosaccharide ABC transporter ATP-binding protein, CUT2 family n=2 Tax=Brevibacterium linens TaxID=1703 RepID=A0A2H1IFF2_BRELN|nr:ATP-binding cassette domain-containing protein [Brevibacterium linens]AZU01516.1 sugar ABC transporter ATP-binding protein [Brevibacterium linens]KAB1948459.1 sugar ABC transporter ATP-binding protein [Brevibacterium linens ATCC 9172]SMX73894.1 monosaccharide ABC transporter ATP-binding protein, CUT2 family [Brevibacterium linens]SMX74806.1 monosaccharide ABC transporter ATP-binding protein, CUT2 family [Brevibacterium linens ATCC 9172]